ncbi:MAG TPA: hypothetical protein VE127_07890 [Solirubrobacteraceae bacterium]|nr:hypothetical protein [Solirubrobacteraceae bacterium]
MSIGQQTGWEHKDGLQTEPPGRGPSGSPETEEREVRAADPELSAQTNARLTEELREVIGSDRVRVPKQRAHVTLGERPQRERGLGVYMSQHRFDLIRASAIALTFGAVISLITNDWWLLPLAAGVHALGTMTVVMTILRLTTVTERPSAELGAALADDGVSSPDEHFSAMVDEFRAEPEGATGEVLSPGHNERTVQASVDPVRAGTEQSTAMTPTADPSEPAGEGGAPDYIIWGTAASLLILSFIVPAIWGGGWMWLLPAVMVPLLVGWVVLQAVIVNRGDAVQITSRKPLVAVVLCTTVAVALFCAIVAIAYTT